MSTLDYALVIEGLDRKSFEAMRSAFSKKLSEIRECLRFAAPYINQGTNRPESPTIPVALLGSALPHLEGPESLKTLDGTLKEITEAVDHLLCPQGSQSVGGPPFVDECPVTAQDGA